MAKHLFTHETAAEMGRKSAASRRLAKGLPPPVTPSLRTDLEIAADLTAAVERLLKRILRTRDPKNISMLAQSIRILRQAWHMYTGAPLPGTLKPGTRMLQVSQHHLEPLGLPDEPDPVPEPQPVVVPDDITSASDASGSGSNNGN